MAKSIHFEPLDGGQSIRLNAGDLGDLLVFAAFDLPEQQGTLLDQGKIYLLGAQPRSANGSTLRLSLVYFLGAGLGRRGLPRGQNRPGGSSSSSIFRWTVAWLSITVSR